MTWDYNRDFRGKSNMQQEKEQFLPEKKNWLQFTDETNGA